MATVPEVNRILWEALDAIYAAQSDAAEQARQAVAKLAAAHSEVVRDPLAREALLAAVERQEGMVRYAQSQLALAETMRSYWAQRSGFDDSEPAPVPLVRRQNPFLATPAASRPKAPAIVAE